MNTIAIVGVGLIGGSFALAMRRAGFAGRILGVSSPRTVAEALRLGVIDEAVTLEEAAAAADLIYLAQPVLGIIETLTLLGPLLRPGCLVTDAGSTKQAIVSHAHRVLSTGTFLGAHPMAGKETRGVESADAELFRGKSYILTPLSNRELDNPLVQDLIEWLKKLEARLLVMTPTEHDRTVAFTSHLPQLISTGLAGVLQEQLNGEEAPLASGSGLQDALRLSLSSWDVWGDIIETNATAIDHALQVYIDKLTNFRQNLQTCKLRDDFATANRAAARFRR